MKTKSKPFSAQLVKYREATMETPVWFWVNPTTGTTLSPHFENQKDAEQWFDDVVKIHTETYNFLDRVKNGTIYNLKCRVKSPPSKTRYPFSFKYYNSVVSVSMLGVDIRDARSRIEPFFEIIEWLE
jgi:hypothetical protein